MSAEARAKMRAGWARRKQLGLPHPRTGIKHTVETRALISSVTRVRTPRGSKCHSFKDGRLSERRGDRFSQRYKRWRFDVFARDSFTCQRCCDSRGGNLNAHHLKPFATHPELRFVISNGITLCDTCHKKKNCASRIRFKGSKKC